MVAQTTAWRVPRKRSLPVVQQIEAAECGLACVCMIAGFYGHEISLSTARLTNPTSLRGCTLQDIVDVASSLKLSARAVRCDIAELSRLGLPAILHWEMKHFVVLKSVSSANVEIHDPATGLRRVPLSEVAEKFTGVALELSPNIDFQSVRERRRLSLSSLVRFDPASRSSIVQAVVLSGVIEIFVLAAPLLMQITIDEVILKGDVGLLGVLAIAFALIAIFSSASSLLRGLTMQYVANALSYDMKARLFRRLTRLPISFIQKRNIGDVQQRFGALDPIKNFLGGGAILAVFDAVLSILTGVLMLAYNVTLGSIVLGATLVYTAIRMSAIAMSRRLAGQAMRAKAKEQSKFLETLRGFSTIKASGIESVREMTWRNNAADTLHAETRLGSLTLKMLAISQFIFGAVDVLIIFLAAKSAIAGELTVGVLTAFIAYKTLFVMRVTAFIEQLVAFRLLDVQLDFVSDIALAEEEPNLDGAGSNSVLRGGIKLRNVRFRYSPRDREILAGVSLVIGPGEFVAIAGASGSGKTTLLRLMSGLIEVSSGEVLIDDFPVRKWGQRALRRQLGIVMQDDQLLAGSIAENITLFDTEYSHENLIEAARLACIEEEIMALPMGFHSLVGDLGNTLSGGQKQRIMIARALYRKPKLLIMDEGTSHIDVATERRINETLKTLEITRIVAAHRPDTLAAADRVLLLSGGLVRIQGQSVITQRGKSANAGPQARSSTGAGWKRRTVPTLAEPE